METSMSSQPCIAEEKVQRLSEEFGKLYGQIRLIQEALNTTRNSLFRSMTQANLLQGVLATNKHRVCEVGSLDPAPCMAPVEPVHEPEAIVAALEDLFDSVSMELLNLTDIEDGRVSSAVHHLQDIVREANALLASLQKISQSLRKENTP